MSNPWEIKTIEYDKTNSEGNVDTTGYGQMSILLSKYVLKEKGKGLSSNDFTNSDKLKLDSVESGAQENKVETLTVNQGQKIYPNSDKNIDITVPTRVSQLANDLGYAKLANMSTHEDYSDSYVGKAKIAFQDEENIAIGKNANANEGGIAIGVNTTTNEIYDVNINNQLLHNQETNVWEGKISESEVANKNSNGTDLTQLDTVIDNLASEVQNRIDGDTTLQNNIDDEIQNRIDGDTTLQNNIDDEIQNRIDGDDLLTINLNAEVQNRTNADNGLSNRITSIDNLIPNQASSENQLADKSFVNSTIQTNTANFRGNWNDWNDVPTDENDYPQDYSGSKIPTINDYLVVQNASDYTLETLSGTWRFKYIGNWETDGKNGWIPEYQVNEEPFTSEQLYAINSGITSNKVSAYDSHLINTSNPHEVTKSQVGLGNVTNVSTESVITEDSNNNITSGAVYTAFADEVSARNTAIENAIKDLDVSSVGGEGKYISAISESDGKISATSTTMDSSPTTDSNNAVTSGGIKSAISTAESNAKDLANATNTLSIAHGGTGGTTATEAEYNILGSVPTVDTSLSDSKYIALRNQTLSSSNGTYRWTSCDNVIKYTESNYPYGVCTTSGNVASKTVTCNNFTLTEGIRFTVKFTNDNTAINPTLTVNSENPYPIYYKGTNIIDNLITADTLITFRFNGEEYDVIGELSASSSSSVTGVKGEAENSYRTGNVNITKSNLGLTTDEMGMKWVNSNIIGGTYYEPYYANGIWVIGSGSTSTGGIKYSLDGKIWSNSNVTSGTFYQPYYANGIWVIGSGASSYNGIQYSLDGKTWNDSNITDGVFYQPYYANGIWVIGSDGSGIKYSLDGKTWNDSNIISDDYYKPYYANGIWVIGSTNSGIKYSLDGKTWSNSNITSNAYYVPHYANGIWVIGSSNNNGIKYSLDGETWGNSNVTSGYFHQPYYANGVWVIGSSNSNAGIKYSLDGKTWSNSNVTSGYFYQPYYANGIWVISGGSGIKYSLDGKTWSDSNIISGSFYKPYYANGIWVISGPSDGIKYSTFNSLDDLGSAFKGITELSEKTTNSIDKISSATLYYGICSTSRTTNAKVVICPTFKLEIGCKIIVKFTDTAGSAPTSGNISLNINGTGAINLYNKNYSQMTYAYSGEFRANRLCEITYDGTYYIWLNYDSNTTYSTITQAEITAGTSTSSRLVTPKLLADNYNKKSSVTNHTLYL